MDNKVVEPTEIIVDGRGPKPNAGAEQANPWVRFLARFFDYAWFFFILWMIRTFLHGQFPFGKYEHLVPFEYFVWIPFEALFLSTWGTTPGKFFLGVQLKFFGSRGKLAYMDGLKRSLAVWLRGLGMCIPFLNILCLLYAYNRLRITGVTSWDKEERIEVRHAPIARWRIVAAALLIIFGFIFYYSDKTISSKTEKYAIRERVHI